MTMIRKLLLATAIGSLAAPLLAQPIAPDVQKRIDRILRKTPLIDGHNDLPEQVRENYRMSVEGLASGTDKRQPKPMMTDMARLHQGRVGGQAHPPGVRLADRRARCLASGNREAGRPRRLGAGSAARPDAALPDRRLGFGSPYLDRHCAGGREHQTSR